MRDEKVKQLAVELLRVGHSLTLNRKGWWLKSPYEAYKKQSSIEIEEFIVDALIADGKIEILQRTHTFEARLK